MWITILSALSAIILFGFIFAGVVRWGLLPSYSDYSSKWGEVIPIHNMNLWGIVTFVAAALLMPVMIELGNDNVFQFLGFFTPVYLMCVSFTPNWKTDETEGKLHPIFAYSCAAAAFAWILFVVKMWPVLLGASLFVIATALLSLTLKTSKIFWLEMIMFVGTYLSLLFV